MVTTLDTADRQARSRRLGAEGLPAGYADRVEPEAASRPRLEEPARPRQRADLSGSVVGRAGR